MHQNRRLRHHIIIFNGRPMYILRGVVWAQEDEAAQRTVVQSVLGSRNAVRRRSSVNTRGMYTGVGKDSLL